MYGLAFQYFTMSTDVKLNLHLFFLHLSIAKYLFCVIKKSHEH